MMMVHVFKRNVEELNRSKFSIYKAILQRSKSYKVVFSGNAKTA